MDDVLPGSRTMSANSLRPRIRECTAESEPESERHELGRLLGTAVERVHDAAGDFDASQMLQKQVGRATHVNDHRQAAVARRAELLAKEPFLTCNVARLEAVDADFTDRNEMRISERLARRLAQTLDINFRHAVDPQRVQPQRVAKAVAMCDACDLGTVVDMARPSCERVTRGGFAPYRRRAVAPRRRQVEAASAIAVAGAAQ